jgi:hypothetical protein
MELWSTATDAARTLWVYSGGDAGLILARPEDPDGPGAAWRPVHEAAVVVPPTRVRALPRALRRTVLEHLESCGAADAAEDLRRHPAVWKQLGERLHPYERPTAFPAAAVAFATLRETRTPVDGPLGAAIVAATNRFPHGDQLARAAADRWDYFPGGHRATVLDLAAWHAAGRADRILLGYPDGTYREIPPDPAAIRAAAATAIPATAAGATATIRATAAIRASAAASAGDRTELPPVDGQMVFAAALDDKRLAELAPGRPAEGSVALTVAGHPPAPWHAIRAGDAAGQLDPVQAETEA